MTAIRHFTASAIVFDDHERVLLVHHNRLVQWLYPGGHIDPNEDPAQAALREVEEETGIRAQVISDPLFTHPAITAHPPPYMILEMQVGDRKVGDHAHIDHVYVLKHPDGDLTAQHDEVAAARWVPIADITSLNTPPELPALITDAARWAKART
ncbi:MAG: NUDIX hydrolase [Streptomycetales bacterium]